MSRPAGSCSGKTGESRMVPRIMYVVEGDLITIQRVDRVSGTPNT